VDRDELIRLLRYGPGGAPPAAFAFNDDPDDPDDDPDEGGADGDPDDNTDGADGSPDDSDGGPDPADLARKVDALEDSFEAERKKREEAETELEKLREERQEAKESNLTEKEKAERAAESAKREAEEARREARKATIDAALEREAAEAGLKSPGRSLKLVDRDAISYDTDTGEVSGAKGAVEDLRDDMPELFRDHDPAPGSTSSPGSGDGKPGDKEAAGGDEPETDYEKGRKAAKDAKSAREGSRL